MMIVENPQTIRVYHGNRQTNMILRPDPIYGTQDFDFAASYARHRSGGLGTPTVHTLEFRFKQLAGEDEIATVRDELGYDDAHILLSLIEEQDVRQRLIEMGFDGAYGRDMAFNSDFAEVPCWVAFNAVRQVRIIESKSL